jgi:hypothetical protein
VDERRDSDGDVLPTFTGDVPEDAVLTGRLLRHRALLTMRRRGVGFGVSGVVAFVAFAVVGLATPWPDWVHGERLPVPTVVVLCAVALLAGVACLVRVIPGWVRFLLAALPGACVLCVGGVANAAWGVYPWATPVGMLGLIGTVAYVVLAGLRVKGWARSRLATLEAR